MKERNYISILRENSKIIDEEVSKIFWYIHSTHIVLLLTYLHGGFKPIKNLIDSSLRDETLRKRLDIHLK